MPKRKEKNMMHDDDFDDDGPLNILDDPMSALV